MLTLKDGTLTNRRPLGYTGLVTYPGGSKEWYKDGKPHRLGKPAWEWSTGLIFWYREGKQHRTDGPACSWVDSTKQWFVENKRLTPKTKIVLCTL